MGARDDERSPDPPQVGLIDRWLAHRGGGAEKPGGAASPEDASAPASTAPAPRSPITSAKQRLAAVRRVRDDRDTSSRALSERLAALVTREGNTPRASEADHAPPGHAPSRRNPTSENTAALGPDDDPDASAPTDEGDEAAPVADDNESTEGTDDLLSALRDLPARTADDQPSPRAGKHRAETPAPPLDDVEPDGPIDPALRQTLLAVEAAEAATRQPERRRVRRVRQDRTRARPSEPATPPPVPTEVPDDLLVPSEPATPDEGAGPVEDAGQPVDLDPTVAATLRARLGDTEQAGAPAAPVPARPPDARAENAPPAPAHQEPRRSAPTPSEPLQSGQAAARESVEPPSAQFAPRRSTRQTVGVLMLVCALATVGAGFLAWETRATTEIAIAATLAVLTLILWSAFTTSAPARLVVDAGVLAIESKQSRHQFDLASPWLELEVRGRPGRRGWQVRIQRRSMEPFVIDSSMVDPREFQPVLDECREIAEQRARENERRRAGR